MIFYRDGNNLQSHRKKATTISGSLFYLSNLIDTESSRFVRGINSRISITIYIIH